MVSSRPMIMMLFLKRVEIDLCSRRPESARRFLLVGVAQTPAANQLGLEHRVFVLNTKPDPIVCFNPKIVHYSEKYAVTEEGCLTFPGLFVKIRRPQWIRVRFHEADGSMRTETLNGLAARAFQHELDHLDGVNYLSRAKKIHMDQAKKKQKLIDRKLKRMQLA